MGSSYYTVLAGRFAPAPPMRGTLAGSPKTLPAGNAIPTRSDAAHASPTSTCTDKGVIQIFDCKEQMHTFSNGGKRRGAERFFHTHFRGTGGDAPPAGGVGAEPAHGNAADRAIYGYLTALSNLRIIYPSSLQYTLADGTQ
jgi:hypothetical protein